jgi:DNA-binding MarR family transcriptional regulator
MLLQTKPQSMSVLSRELGTTVSAITKNADRLEATGLVERVQDTGDRRSKCLKLTAQGTEMMRWRRQIRTERARQALARLSPLLREELLQSLDSLMEACLENTWQGSPNNDKVAPPVAEEAFTQRSHDES